MLKNHAKNVYINKMYVYLYFSLQIRDFLTEKQKLVVMHSIFQVKMKILILNPPSP